MAFPNGFKPTFHPDRLVELYKLKPPGKKKRKPWIARAFPSNWLIFESSMGDLFGDWVPESWAGNVLFTIENCNEHIFLIPTKNARNLLKWNKSFPSNLWLGTSVTCQEDAERIAYLRMTTARTKYISFEPLLNGIKADLRYIDWIVIGGQTRPTRIPEKRWVQPLIDQARERGIPVFLKDNLGWPETIREFPKTWPVVISSALIDGPLDALPDQNRRYMESISTKIKGDK
jgi:protein gp37